MVVRRCTTRGRTTVAPPALRLAQNPEADELLARDPLALLVGMLLDQRVPLEWAFGAPYRLAQRLGRDSLDAGEIAAHEPEAFFTKVMVGPPALHRYPAVMAGRVQALCRHLTDADSLAEVRAFKQAAKQAARGG